MTHDEFVRRSLAEVERLHRLIHGPARREAPTVYDGQVFWVSPEDRAKIEAAVRLAEALRIRPTGDVR